MERIREEEVMIDIFQRELRKIMKNISRDSTCLIQDSNREPPNTNHTVKSDSYHVRFHNEKQNKSYIGYKLTRSVTIIS
jgi:hypothetical protein